MSVTGGGIVVFGLLGIAMYIAIAGAVCRAFQPSVGDAELLGVLWPAVLPLGAVYYGLAWLWHGGLSRAALWAWRLGAEPSIPRARTVRR